MTHVSQGAISTSAAVYGGGGLFGIGYTLGITEAFVDAGIDLQSLPSLGTSAGSWAAAALALRIRFIDALDLIGDDVPRFPDPRRGRLRTIARELFGAATLCPTVRVVACALPGLRRTVLRGAETPIADLIAASASVPGILAPQRIGNTNYIDGGVRSMASIDLADPVDRLLVVLPLSAPMFGPAGWLIERGIQSELRKWQGANATSQRVVARPTSEIAALARRPDQLFDPDRARRCYELAYRQGLTILPKWNDAVSSAQFVHEVPFRSNDAVVQ